MSELSTFLGACAGQPTALASLAPVIERRQLYLRRSSIWIAS